MTNTIFVYTHRAYTSEVALFMYEGVTADEAMHFEYEGEVPASKVVPIRSAG